MKTLKVIFATVVMGIVFTSCNKQNIQPNQTQTQSQTKSIMLTFMSSEYVEMSAKTNVTYTDGSGQLHQEEFFIGGYNGALSLTDVNMNEPVIINSGASTTLYGVGGGQITNYYYGTYNLYVDGALTQSIYTDLFFWSIN